MDIGDDLVLQHPPTEKVCDQCGHPIRHHHLGVKWAICLNDLTGRYVDVRNGWTQEETKTERQRRADLAVPECSGACRTNLCPAWIQW